MQAQTHRTWSADPERIWRVVRETAGGPMNTLGRPGWFTAPERVLEEGKQSAFSYIFGMSGRFEAPAPEAYLNLLAVSPELEKKLRRPAASPPLETPGPGKEREGHAEREFKEWAWTERWDTDAWTWPPVWGEGDLPPEPGVDDVNASWSRALEDWREQDLGRQRD